MVQLLGSSITYRIAVGPQQGRKVFTLQTLPGRDVSFDAGVGKVAGFSLHTGVAARADQRQKLERLCRYISRPAIAEKRLSLTPNGSVRYQLKTPCRDGTTVIFEPLDFIARLAALMPKPRVNLTRFHGVFAPNSKHRARVTPAKRGRGAQQAPRPPPCRAPPQRGLFHAYPVDAQWHYLWWLGLRWGVGMNPAPIIQRVVGRCCDATPDAECRGERGHRVAAPVGAEHEFVEVGGQVLRAHTVMRTQQPRLQIGEDEMDHRQRLLGLLGVTAEHDRRVLVADALQVVVPSPAVGDDAAVGLDAIGDERLQRSLATIIECPQAQPPSVDGTTAARGLFAANLDGTDDIGLVMHAASFAPRLAADERLVQFDRPLGADAVLVRAYHPSAQLVQHLECRLVAAQPKLPLELQRRQARRLRRHEVRSPEPDLQWRAGRVHNSPRREVGVALAVAAAQDRRPVLEAVCRAHRAAQGACETIRPTDSFEIGHARPLVGKHPLEIKQGRREAIRHSQALPIGFLGVNRIGME